MNLPCGVKLRETESNQVGRMLQNIRDGKLVRYRNERAEPSPAVGGFESFQNQQTPPLIRLDKPVKDYRRVLHVTLTAIEARYNKYRDTLIGQGAYGRVFEVRHYPILLWGLIAD